MATKSGNGGHPAKESRPKPLPTQQDAPRAPSRPSRRPSPPDNPLAPPCISPLGPPLSDPAQDQVETGHAEHLEDEGDTVSEGDLRADTEEPTTPPAMDSPVLSSSPPPSKPSEEEGPILPTVRTLPSHPSPASQRPKDAGVRAQPRLLRNPSTLENVSSTLSSLAGHVSRHLPEQLSTVTGAGSSLMPGRKRRSHSVSSPSSRHLDPASGPSLGPSLDALPDGGKTRPVVSSIFSTTPWFPGDARTRLYLGYADGLQIWEIPAAGGVGEVREVYSVRLPYTVIAIHPLPITPDRFEGGGPALLLLAMREGRTDAILHSVRSGQSHTLALHAQGASVDHRRILLSIPGSPLSILDPHTLEEVACIEGGVAAPGEAVVHGLGSRLLAYITHHPSPLRPPMGPAMGPAARGEGASGHDMGTGTSPNGAETDSMVTPAVREVVTGVKTLGAMGYQRLSRWYKGEGDDASLPLSSPYTSSASSTSSKDGSDGEEGDPTGASTKVSGPLPQGTVAVEDLDGRWAKVVFRAHGSKGCSLLSWDPSGRHLLSVSGRGDVVRVWRVDLHLGPAAVHCVWEGRRGYTSAIVRHVVWSEGAVEAGVGAGWLALGTAKGTTHLWCGAGDTIGLSPHRLKEGGMAAALLGVGSGVAAGAGGGRRRLLPGEERAMAREAAALRRRTEQLRWIGMAGTPAGRLRPGPGDTVEEDDEEDDEDLDHDRRRSHDHDARSRQGRKHPSRRRQHDAKAKTKTKARSPPSPPSNPGISIWFGRQGKGREVWSCGAGGRLRLRRVLQPPTPRIAPWEAAVSVEEVAEWSVARGDHWGRVEYSPLAPSSSSSPSSSPSLSSSPIVITATTTPSPPRSQSTPTTGSWLEHAEILSRDPRAGRGLWTHAPWVKFQVYTADTRTRGVRAVEVRTAVPTPYGWSRTEAGEPLPSREMDEQLKRAMWTDMDGPVPPRKDLDEDAFIQVRVRSAPAMTVSPILHRMAREEPLSRSVEEDVNGDGDGDGDGGGDGDGDIDGDDQDDQDDLPLDHDHDHGHDHDHDYNHDQAQEEVSLGSPVYGTDSFLQEGLAEALMHFEEEAPPEVDVPAVVEAAPEAVPSIVTLAENHLLPEMHSFHDEVPLFEDHYRQETLYVPMSEDEATEEAKPIVHLPPALPSPSIIEEEALGLSLLFPTSSTSHSQKAIYE